MITADEPGRPVVEPGPATSASCGRLVAGAGVSLRWPDGELTSALPAGVTGLGPAGIGPAGVGPAGLATARRGAAVPATSGAPE
jgi:hypothetical protein